MWEVNVISTSKFVFPVFSIFYADTRKYSSEFRDSSCRVLLIAQLSPPSHLISSALSTLSSPALHAEWALLFIALSWQPTAPRRVSRMQIEVACYPDQLALSRDNVCNLQSSYFYQPPTARHLLQNEQQHVEADRAWKITEHSLILNHAGVDGVAVEKAT